MRLVLIILAILMATPAAAVERLSVGGLSSVVWSPPGDGATPVPLVIFSHGFGGCATQSKFLTAGLARAGYLVVAPNHADARCGRWLGKPQIPFRTPDLWSETTHADRRDDIRTLLAALKADPEWSARIDWDHVGLMGHSLGGYAALGMAGAWPGWTTPEIGAVVAMSPYCTPFLEHGGLERIRVPVMYQGGSIDRPITPTVVRRGGCYDQTSAPAWYVEIRGAWHLRWTDLNMLGSSRTPMLRTVVAFFDQELKGTGRLRPVPGVTAFREK